jgi:hypothetical protein
MRRQGWMRYANAGKTNAFLNVITRNKITKKFEVDFRRRLSQITKGNNNTSSTITVLKT